MRNLIDAFNRVCIRVWIEYENTMIETGEAIRDMREDLHFRLAALRMRGH